MRRRNRMGRMMRTRMHSMEKSKRMRRSARRRRKGMMRRRNKHRWR